MKKNHTILQTLTIVMNSKSPVSVEQVQEVTGFGERRVQRHLSDLKELGFVKRIGESGQSGYRYVFSPISAG